MSLGPVVLLIANLTLADGAAVGPRGILFVEATPILRWFEMLRGSSSAAGVRFLSSIKEGRGLKPSARDAGIDKEVGYRWLREKYLHLRRDGKTPAETTAELGFTTSRLLAWEADVGYVLFGAIAQLTTRIVARAFWSPRAGYSAA